MKSTSLRAVLSVKEPPSGRTRVSNPQIPVSHWSALNSPQCPAVLPLKFNKDPSVQLNWMLLTAVLSDEAESNGCTLKRNEDKASPLGQFCLNSQVPVLIYMIRNQFTSTETDVILIMYLHLITLRVWTWRWCLACRCKRVEWNWEPICRVEERPVNRFEFGNRWPTIRQDKYLICPKCLALHRCRLKWFSRRRHCRPEPQQLIKQNKIIPLNGAVRETSSLWV